MGRVPFLRAIGLLESSSPRVITLSDEGEEFEIGDSPCSWITDYPLGSCVGGYQ